MLKTMTPFQNLVLMLLSLLSTNIVVHAAKSSASMFSYDITDMELGPLGWGTLDMEDNQCGGSVQSPIAIETTSCTEYANYIFTVRIHLSDVCQLYWPVFYVCYVVLERNKKKITLTLSHVV
jgi:hypothetical protein